MKFFRSEVGRCGPHIQVCFIWIIGLHRFLYIMLVYKGVQVPNFTGAGELDPEEQLPQHLRNLDFFPESVFLVGLRPSFGSFDIYFCVF